MKDGVNRVDETGLLPIRDLANLTEVAKDQYARLVLQGDSKQCRSVVRHGDMLNVNSGTFKAGDRVRMSDWKPTDRYASTAHFSVYRPDTLPLAAGDLVMFTSMESHCKVTASTTGRVPGKGERPEG